MSRLDRVTLQLGVAVAVVIACCSYAVSATSLYALGVQAGYSWWQAAAVPVVADGPAIYGMFRIISRSRRGAKGAGYGWLLVVAGTLASIGGNVAHAQPDLVAQAIAAAIPLAVLAMLEGLKGDAGEVTRLAAQAADRRPRGHARAGRPAPASHHGPTHRPHRQPGHRAPADRRLPAACAARRARTDRPHHGRGAAAGGLCPTAAGRPALDGPHPGRGRRLWPQQRRQLPATPAPTGCGAHPMSRPSCCCATPPSAMPPAASRSCPCTTPSPTAATSSRLTGDHQPAVRRGPAARVGIRAAASSAKHPLGSLVPHGVKDATTNRARVLAWWTRHPQANIGLATGHAFDVLDVDGPAGAHAIRALAAAHGLHSSGPLVRTGGGGWHYYLAPTGLGNVQPSGLGHVDWRGRGGYVVAPPSRHASGHPYQWVAGRDLDTPLAEVPSVLLRAAPAPPAPAASRSGPAPGRRRRPG